MNDDKKNERIQQIYQSLKEKNTDELISIWKTNDKSEWTGEAFEAISIILLVRNGSLPEQNENKADEKARASANRKKYRTERGKVILKLMLHDGLPFGIVWMMFFPVEKIFFYHLSPVIGWHYSTETLYALVGAISSAVLAYTTFNQKKMLFFSVAGALACGIGYRLGNDLSLIMYPPPLDGQNLKSMSIILTIYFTIGCFHGAALGIVQWNWRQFKWLVLAGALGFSSYYVVTVIVNKPFVLILNYIVSLKNYSPDRPGLLPYLTFAISMLRGLVFGTVYGALLGLALRIEPPEQT